MSETKIIFVSIPNEKLQEKLDILEMSGIKLLSKSIHYSENYILFHIEKQRAYSYFESSHFVDDPKFKKVNSWREFALEILKYYYCEVETSDQADFLYNSIGQGSTDYGDGIYFRYSIVLAEFSFFSSVDNKEQLTFDGFKLLLNSTKENNMKNQEKINLELTPQEAAFLVAYTAASLESTKHHLREAGIYFMDEFIKTGKKSELWQKLKQPLCNTMGIEGSLYDLNKLEPLFHPKIPLFGFKNGLVTKINNDTVSVGCKTKKPQDWIKYCDQIIELGLDKVEIDGYSFSKVEIDRFREWLKNNF